MSMPREEGMSDNEVAMLILSGIVRDRDRLDADIAEKKMQLYELQGSTKPPEEQVQGWTSRVHGRTGVRPGTRMYMNQQLT
jgi:hypothetical protein